MTDKPSASERQDELAEAFVQDMYPMDCFSEANGTEFRRIDALKDFKAGYDSAVKEMLQGDFEILGLNVEQIEQLKTFFEMQTAMKVNEYGGSLIDNLVKDNAALSKEVAELKAERESHFALEESVLRELKAERDELKLFVSSVELHESIANAKAVLKERDELRSGIDAFKYAADQNSIAANAWKLQAENLRETLGMVDSVGMEHKYALIVKEALAAFQKFREGK